MILTTKAEKRLRQKAGIKAAMPILIGSIPYALVLGAQAEQKGLSLIEVPLLTGLNFAGGSEFAAIGLWASPPPILTIALVTFLVNSRHILMGGILSPFLKKYQTKHILPSLFFMCDESWALSIEDIKKRQKHDINSFLCFHHYFGAALVFFIMWVSCTLLGAFIGPMLGPIDHYGFNMAFPAVFLVLLVGMWENWQVGRAWIISLICAASLHLLMPHSAFYVLGGTIAGLLFAASQKPTPTNINNTKDQENTP